VLARDRADFGGVKSDQSVINKAIKRAVKLLSMDKRVSAHTFRHYSESRTMPSAPGGKLV
jgi:integrase